MSQISLICKSSNFEESIIFKIILYDAGEEPTLKSLDLTLTENVADN